MKAPGYSGNRTLTNVVIVLLLLLILTSCAEVASVDECLYDRPQGFWWGLLHGFIAPFAFIVSLFKDSVAVYAVNNNGGWYDFGFLLGAATIFGGGTKASKKR